MALTNHPSNSIFRSSGNGINLSNGMDLLVDPGIIIATASGNGVEAAGSNTLTCNGAVGGTFGIDFRGPDSQLTVGAGGSVSGSDTGVVLIGSGSSSMINNGVIFGGHTGIYVATGVALVNNGTIQSGEASSDQSAIYLSGSTLPKVVLNKGTIEAKLAGTFAILSGDVDAPDTIINAGMIKGFVRLKGGDDVYNGLTGTISRGTIDGGRGSDKITGGVGVETMTGGADDDTFYFKTKPNAAAVDHITDFVHGQDHIGLSKSLFKLDPGQSVASAFQDITAGLSKQGENKHILYNHDTGWLSYDADGKGGAAPIHFATLDTHPIITSGDILMV